MVNLFYFEIYLKFIINLRDFESLAYDLLQHCYEDNKNNCEDIILLPDENFNNKNSFEFVRDDFDIDFDKENNDEKHFILHDCFQNVVERVWSGDCHKMSKIFYFMTFFIYLCHAPVLWIFYIILHVNEFMKFLKNLLYFENIVVIFDTQLRKFM